MIVCFMNQYEFGTSMKRHGESEVMGVWSMEVGLVSLFLHQNPSCFSKPINLSNPDLPRTLHDFPIFRFSRRILGRLGYLSSFCVSVS